MSEQEEWSDGYTKGRDDRGIWNLKAGEWFEVEEVPMLLNALTRERDELRAALEAAAEKFQRIQWVALPSTMVMARAMDGEQAVRDALDTLTNKAAGGKEA
jgi:hypothetical protein